MINIEKNFEKNGYVIVPGDKNLLDNIRNIIFLGIKNNNKIKNKKITPENINYTFNNFHKLSGIADNFHKNCRKLDFKFFLGFGIFAWIYHKQ